MFMPVLSFTGIKIYKYINTVLKTDVIIDISLPLFHLNNYQITSTLIIKMASNSSLFDNLIIEH